MGKSGKPRAIYKVTKIAKKSGNKSNKALKSYDRLQERVKKEGETAWLKNALAKNANKLQKYGLKPRKSTKKAA